MPLIRFDIKSRVPYAEDRHFGVVGAFEQVDGTAHFAVDPLHDANALICDLRLAPRTAGPHGGKVELLELLRVIEARAHRIRQRRVLVQHLQVDLVGPPIAVGACLDARVQVGEGAFAAGGFGMVFHGR